MTRRAPGGTALRYRPGRENVGGLLGRDVSAWLGVVFVVDRFTSETVYQSVPSDSGRLFFDSYDALVPSDVNGVADVYEWGPEGIKGPKGKVGCAAGAARAAMSSSRDSVKVEPAPAGTQVTEGVGRVASTPRAP